jgi:hypothetical protein
LNAAGRDRADALARVFGLAGVTTIRTSQFTPHPADGGPRRTAARTGPAARPAPPVLAQKIRAGELGDVVLVAGHSNTLPQLVPALGAAPPPPITEREFDNLYVVTVSADATQLLHLRYGAP